MAVTSQNFFTGTLTGSFTTLYTAPTRTTAVIKAASFSNETGAVVPVLVQVTAGSASVLTTVIPSTNIADTDSYYGAELVNQVIEGGGTIQASGDGLTAMISGVEIV